MNGAVSVHMMVMSVSEHRSFISPSPVIREKLYGLLPARRRL